MLTIIALVVCGFPGCHLSAKDKKSGAATSDNAATNLNMLQGKWQALDDKSVFLVFENNHRKEKGGNEQSWDDEVFVLTDNPMSEGKEVSDQIAEDTYFIYCAKSDMCWAIEELTAQKLVLVFKNGRGGLLEYRKVKQVGVGKKP